MLRPKSGHKLDVTCTILRKVSQVCKAWVHESDVSLFSVTASAALDGLLNILLSQFPQLLNRNDHASLVHLHHVLVLSISYCINFQLEQVSSDCM